MSKTSRERSKTLLVFNCLSKAPSWSILHGFWIRFGRVLEARGCVTNQASYHKNVCQGVLSSQVRSSTILDAFWRPTGVILALLWGVWSCGMNTKLLSKNGCGQILYCRTNDFRFQHFSKKKLAKSELRKVEISMGTFWNPLSAKF